MWFDFLVVLWSKIRKLEHAKVNIDLTFLNFDLWILSIIILEFYCCFIFTHHFFHWLVYFCSTCLIVVLKVLIASKLQFACKNYFLNLNDSQLYLFITKSICSLCLLCNSHLILNTNILFLLFFHIIHPFVQKFLMRKLEFYNWAYN